MAASAGASTASATPGSRVLVTGAGGFIGSHVVEQLVESGAIVRALVRYNSRNDWGRLQDLSPAVLAEVDVYTGDLANPEAVAAAVAGCETVLHLGALIPIPYSYRHPREFLTVNVEGTMNVLEAARRADVRRVVHLSSSEVYGTAQQIPIPETHPLHPQSPYAASKVAADQLALSYFRSFALPVVIARPFNTFGPRQSARAVIPTIIAQALARDHIELGALDTTRDFSFVTDTARGVIHCASAAGVEGEELNLGTGEEHSIARVVADVGAILGRKLTVIESQTRLRPPASEVRRLVADCTKMRMRTGWQPRVSFAEGLEQTIAWLEAALPTFKPELYNV
jgi:NAD dependent epimerase/dehydratase